MSSGHISEFSGGSDGSERLEILEVLEKFEELPRVLCSTRFEDVSAVVSVDLPDDGPFEESSVVFPELAEEGADDDECGLLL